METEILHLAKLIKLFAWSCPTIAFANVLMYSDTAIGLTFGPKGIDHLI